MIDAARKAGQVWPEGALDESLGGLLAWTGLVRASAESPPRKKELDEDGRVYGTALLMLHASRGPDGEAAIASAAQCARRSLEAARIAKAKMKNCPGSRR